MKLQSPSSRPGKGVAGQMCVVFTFTWSPGAGEMSGIYYILANMTVKCKTK